ncbi:MAG: isochorismatase family protein [Pseudomonadota bacterium]
MAHTALLLIDWQQGLRDAAHFGQRNNPASEVNAARLLAAARAAGVPVYHVRHASTEEASPLRPDRPGYAFEPFAEPRGGEPEYVKHVNSAFIGTTLEADLRSAGVTHVVVTGVTTDHCVSTSVRKAGNLGFKVTLAGDACHTFERVAPDGDWVSAEAMHRSHLASLHGEFCSVVAMNHALEVLA